MAVTRSGDWNFANDCHHIESHSTMSILLASEAQQIAVDYKRQEQTKLLRNFKDHFDKIDACILHRARAGEYSATYSDIPRNEATLCELHAKILEVYRSRGYATRLDIITGQMNIYWSPTDGN